MPVYMAMEIIKLREKRSGDGPTIIDFPLAVETVSIVCGTGG